MIPNNSIEKSRSGFSAGNPGLFKKRNYKYFEYKKVKFVWYYVSIVLIKWSVMFDVL